LRLRIGVATPPQVQAPVVMGPAFAGTTEEFMAEG